MSEIDRTTLAERIGRFFRAMYPSRTADCVAADTSLKAETIQKIIDRASVPNGLTMIVLAAAYGPDFLIACMGDKAPAWLSAAHREAEAARIDREIEELKARRASLRA